MISFILTVLNRPDMLTHFFQKLPFQSGEYEFVLVDNASDAPTKQVEFWLQNTFKNVLLVENSRNEGFGPGNNTGAEIANGDILVFTQPDVEFHGDVTKMVSEVVDGILYGHQLLDYDTGWNRFGNIIVPYLTGYFLACTKHTWKVLGGFDPRYYPADFEDVDLSFTAIHNGLGLKEIDVPVTHDHFGSTWAQFSNREETTKRNRGLFAQKWGL